ncbi:MAG TPA: hypothetical protein VEB21_08785, partial [Terriglobales bacterium]|nr:hypothetical protein [Terriglobales bacterium]
TLAPQPDPCKLKQRVTNSSGANVTVRFSGRYIGGPVENGFTESYGPFLQTLPPGTFDIIVNGTFNSGLWEHQVTITANGQVIKQETTLVGGTAFNIVPWTLGP